MIPVLVALDFASLDEAEGLARRLAGKVAGFKVGLELLMGRGAGAVERIAALGSPVFADAKLFDIPHTVAAATRQLSDAGARWVTVHGGGGREMVAAAVEGAGGGAGILVVTALTSLDDEDLMAVGFSDSVPELVVRRTRLARDGGAEGVICSPGEAGLVKSTAPQLLVVTPGIRLPGGEPHDQKRVSTPAEAVGAGADLLVVGRAITAAEDPVATVAEIASQLGR